MMIQRGAVLGSMYLLLCALPLVLGCGSPTAAPSPASPVPRGQEETMGFSVTSTAFAEGERIPKQYTCDGDNQSPPLSWSGAPKGTVEFALICNDPDAPSGNWIHWVLYGLPAAITSLPTGLPNAETVIDLGGAKQGRNTAEGLGYTGPCPPKGPEHHYHFRVYALDAEIDLAPGAAEGELLQAMEGHVLGEAGLMGLYGR